jgi:hypothetical protein
MPNTTPITPPRVPLIDSRTGLIDRAWYLFFLSLFTKIGTSNFSIEDLQLGPPVGENATDIAVAAQQAQLFNLTQSQIDELGKQLQALALTPPAEETDIDIGVVAQQAQLLSITQSQIDELSKQIQALALTPPAEEVAAGIEVAAQQAQLLSITQSQVDELSKQVQALALTPPVTPTLRRQSYGSFYDTTTQVAAVIDTAYAFTYNTTDLSNGVYLGSPTSRVYVDRLGVYDIQFSARLDNTDGGSHLIFIWLRVNGVDVANSASQIRIKNTDGELVLAWNLVQQLNAGIANPASHVRTKGTDGELVAAWNFVQQLNAGDYFELMWSVDSTAVQVFSQDAATLIPAIPSIILTVTDNINAYQD